MYFMRNVLWTPVLYHILAVNLFCRKMQKERRRHPSCHTYLLNMVVWLQTLTILLSNAHYLAICGKHIYMICSRIGYMRGTIPIVVSNPDKSYHTWPKHQIESDSISDLASEWDSQSDTISMRLTFTTSLSETRLWWNSSQLSFPIPISECSNASFSQHLVMIIVNFKSWSASWISEIQIWLRTRQNSSKYTDPLKHQGGKSLSIQDKSATRIIVRKGQRWPQFKLKMSVKNEVYWASVVYVALFISRQCIRYYQEQFNHSSV